MSKEFGAGWSQSSQKEVRDNSYSLGKSRPADRSSAYDRSAKFSQCHRVEQESLDISTSYFSNNLQYIDSADRGQKERRDEAVAQSDPTTNTFAQRWLEYVEPSEATPVSKKSETETAPDKRARVRKRVRGSKVHFEEATYMMLHENFIKLSVSKMMVDDPYVTVRFCELVNLGTELIISDMDSDPRLRTGIKQNRSAMTPADIARSHWNVVGTAIRVGTGIVVPEPLFDDMPPVRLSAAFLKKKMEHMGKNPFRLEQEDGNISCAINLLIWKYACFYRDRCFRIAHDAGRDVILVEDIDKAMKK